MKEIIKKTLKYLLLGLGIILLTMIFFKGLNSLIFKTSLSKKFDNSYWIGSWNSSETLFASGKIVVDLPYNLPINEPIYVDMLVYYNVWSLYNTCGTSEFKCVGLISENNSASGNSGITENSIDKKEDSKSFSFSAKFTSATGQEIEYNGVVNINRTKIIGGYISSHPNDFGDFILKRI